jgi:hypothetical protein
MLGSAISDIRSFRLGDYGLIEVIGARPRYQEVRKALLWEWAASPAGVIIRIDSDEPVDDRVVRGLVADAGTLVRTWPGTPIGLITPNRELCEGIAQDPHGAHLVVSTNLREVWDGMWSRGGKANITIELPPSVQAPRTARDFVVRACRDWNLDTLVDPAALLTGDLVGRSVVQGAQDIHFTVSRHGSRVRVLARDDVAATTADGARIPDDVLGSPFMTPALSRLADSTGEFALDAHHVRWAVTHDPRAA